MYNAAKRSRSSRRKGCRRNRVQRGGTDGYAYRFGASVDPTNPSLGNAAEVIRFSSCEEATRPGYIQDAQIKGGLPGFAGGMRGGSASKAPGETFMVGGSSSKAPGETFMVGGSDSKAPGETFMVGGSDSKVPGETFIIGGRRRKNRRLSGLSGGRGAFTTGASQANIYGAQAGGRYTNEFNVVGDAKIAMMEPSYSGCGDGMVAMQNPLNKGDISSLITAPPPLVPTPSPGSGDTLQKGGRKRRGHRSRRRNQMGGVGGVDSMVYEAPRTGYTHEPSTSAGGQSGTLADGKTPFLVNVPYTTQPTPSSACLHTGGRRKTRRNRRKSRKNRKSRRSNSRR